MKRITWQHSSIMGNISGAEVNLEEYFKKVGEVRDLLDKISHQAKEVERKHGAILSSPNPDRKSKDELEMLNKETKKSINVARSKLKSMHRSLPVDENGNSASVSHRIQKNQHSDITRRFVEVTKGYYKAQISFREKCKDRIQRQLDIANRMTTDEELEEMLQSVNPSIFVSNFTADSRVTSRALTEIESRHRDIVSLESNIKEMQEIFMDTAMLVEVQGDLMNNIEKNVTSAAEYVGASKGSTDNAVMYKKNPYTITSLQRSFKKPNSGKTTAGPKR
ncbi:syntaxin-2-like isoform X1 [Genypterus blacodes]|uniref:syntaxin-2-like isoform X1 n=1 Tax=Genypterus blacodes TaxID=154954 RepID=UPI003F77604C